MRIYIYIFAVLALAATAETPQGIKKEHSSAMQQETTGSFEVKILPPAAGDAPADGFARLSLDKTFQGGLEGTSRVAMLASGGGGDASGGYVALERFTGKLMGRQGGFIMQHSGTMSPGSMEINVVVTPGSGTGELAGISGSLAIRREGKQHFYTLRFALPKE